VQQNRSSARESTKEIFSTLSRQFMPPTASDTAGNGARQDPSRASSDAREFARRCLVRTAERGGCVPQEKDPLILTRFLLDQGRRPFRTLDRRPHVDVRLQAIRSGLELGYSRRSSDCLRPPRGSEVCFR